MYCHAPATVLEYNSQMYILVLASSDKSSVYEYCMYSCSAICHLGARSIVGDPDRSARVNMHVIESEQQEQRSSACNPLLLL